MLHAVDTPRRLVHTILAIAAGVGERTGASRLIPRRGVTPPEGTAEANPDHKPATAVVRFMGRLGLFYVTAVITLMSAALSAFFAWLFSLVIDIPALQLYLGLAFVIPFLVTPILTLLSVLSMRDLIRARKRAIDLARQDMLTGLGNRRAFFDTARKLCAEARGTLTSQAVLFIDIDHFKSINDRHGHDAGDAVLKHFASLLKDCTRADDFVARIGGEEFAVHVVNIEHAGLAAIAQGLMARVRASAVSYGEGAIRYRVSVGGVIGDPAAPIDKLLSLADKQLYEVKRDGRDAFRIIDARGAGQPRGEASPDMPRTRRPAA